MVNRLSKTEEEERKANLENFEKNILRKVKLSDRGQITNDAVEEARKSKSFSSREK